MKQRWTLLSWSQHRSLLAGVFLKWTSQKQSVLPYLDLQIFPACPLCSESRGHLACQPASGPEQLGRCLCWVRLNYIKHFKTKNAQSGGSFFITGVPLEWVWCGWINLESGGFVKTKEILPGSGGDDATDTPSLLPQQACPLTIFTNGQQRQPHLHKYQACL